MVRLRRLTAVVLVCAAALLPARAANAGPLMDHLVPDDGPEPAYSRLRFWAPALARLHDKCHGPKLGVYAPDRHPEIPPTTTILTFPCPAVEPAATLIRPPTPPAESKFRYY
jgi:hypothetical protein